MSDMNRSHTRAEIPGRDDAAIREGAVAFVGSASSPWQSARANGTDAECSPCGFHRETITAASAVPGHVERRTRRHTR